MPLVKWDPFSNIATLQNRINRLFEDAFPRGADDQEDLSACAWRPLVDIFDSESGVTILVDLPGVKKEDVSVEVKENLLTIKGERFAAQMVDENKYYRRERACGTFNRAFAMRGTIEPDKIKATFKNGVLKVEIPKPEEMRPKQVTVSID